jgi:chromate transporter
MSRKTAGQRQRRKPPTLSTSGSALEVLLVFLRLGVTCFGGPIAHLGYFREEFVVRRRWLDEQAYGDLVGLCQFLPGPASSQVGFSIGLMRAGYRGGLAAWTGFTLPSAITLVLFAHGAGELGGPTGIGLLHGLKLVAVAVVAQAVWGMARTLCPDRPRASIAVVAALIILFSASSLAQIAAIVWGGLLREAFVTPGWVSDDAFLAGYGAAQVVPGPLFTLAAYLGAVVSPSPHGLAGAALGLIGIFLPGMLILMGTLPFWDTFRKRSDAQAMMRGVNAAVVGLLGAALYNPLWTSSVKTPGDFGIALVGFVLLTVWRAPPLVVVVVISALGGIALAQP